MLYGAQQRECGRHWANLVKRLLLVCSTPPPLQAPASVAGIDKKQLVADVCAALYCSKICSYAQGMNIIKAKSDEKNWGVDLGGLARIWKVGGAQLTPNPVCLSAGFIRQ